MNSIKTRIFFCLLSGENPELAFYELESILLAFDKKDILKKTSDPRIANIVLEEDSITDSSIAFIKAIIQRSTLLHWCCQTIFQEEMKISTLEDVSRIKSVFTISSLIQLNKNSSFRIRTKRIGDPEGIFSDSNITQDFNEFIGFKIQRQYPSKPVELKHPDETYYAVISNNGLWVGLHLADSPRKIVRKRTARNRPFFHPSSMNPILQRTLINLTAIRKGEWLLDPFCGTGGALIEAAYLEFKSVGLEIDRRIIWGARKNITSDSLALPRTNIILGDAKHLGFANGVFSGVVTDPPYGTAASTKGFNLPDLLLKFCNEIKPILRSKSRIVIVVPSNLNIEKQMAKLLDASYKIFFQYVHRSLTRKILVFSLQE